MSFSDAAGFVVTYGTSYHALVDRAAIQPGETLLVLGASGGVGLTAIEIGKALGARVVAAASSEAKLEVCKQHGADELINYTTGNLRERVAQVAPSGVDVVYDPVGGDHAATAVRALSTAGRYLTVGYASGQIPKIGMNRLLVVGGALHGVLWGAWAKRNPECNADNMRALFDMYDGARSVSSCEQHPPADHCSYRTRGSHESTSAGQSHPLNQPRMTIHDKRCRQWT